jgi:hypothetical protein
MEGVRPAQECISRLGSFIEDLVAEKTNRLRSASTPSLLFIIVATKR